MELLKQPQYNPLPVENQVMIIYAAINHYLEEVGVANVKNYEKEFLEYMTSTYPEVGRSIKEEGKLTEATEETLKAAIAKFNERYLRALGVSIMRPDEAEAQAAEQDSE
jgi:F-type H+-transporting ATPase subunit alpha